MKVESKINCNLNHGMNLRLCTDRKSAAKECRLQICTSDFEQYWAYPEELGLVEPRLIVSLTNGLEQYCEYPEEPGE